MKAKLLLLTMALRVFTLGLLAADKPNVLMILASDVGPGNFACTIGTLSSRWISLTVNEAEKDKLKAVLDRLDPARERSGK